jgi:hypothetical protein
MKARTVKPASAKAKRSLAEFMLAKRRAGCVVCALPVPVREQLANASKHKIKRAEQIEWLEAEFGLKLTRAQFDAHSNGRHEQ